MTEKSIATQKISMPTLSKEPVRCTLGVNGVIQQMFTEPAEKSIRLYHPRQEYQARPVPKHLVDLIEKVMSGKTTNTIQNWTVPPPVNKVQCHKPLDRFISDLFQK